MLSPACVNNTVYDISVTWLPILSSDRISASP